MSTGLVILGSFAFAALIVSGIAELIISRKTKKRKPMATVNKPSDEFITWQKATQQSAIDDKMPDDAIFIKKPKAMTAPIKRNKPKKSVKQKGKAK